MTDRLLTIPEVEDRLAVSRWTLGRLIREGDLKPVRIGRSLRVPDDEVDAYIKRLREVDAEEIPA